MRLTARTSLSLFAVVVLATALRCAFFVGYHGYDDVYYMQRAIDFAQGRFDLPTTHWAARLGTVVPAGISIALFGIDEVSMVLFPFACSLAGILFSFLFCRAMYGECAAVYAALLLALVPIDVLFASMLFPTAPVTLCTGIALGCFLWAEKVHNPWIYFASGAASGCAILAHEAALLSLAAYPILVATAGGRRRTSYLVPAGLVGSGVVATVALDPLLHGLMGDPWIHLSIVRHVGTVIGIDAEVKYAGLNSEWLFEPFVRLFSDKTSGLYTALLTPLVIYRLWRPAHGTDRRLAILLAFLFAWSVYGSVSSTTYAPLPRLPRYLAPIFLLSAWFFGRELALLPGRLALFVSGMLIVNSIFCLSLDPGDQLRTTRQLAHALRELHEPVVHVESAYQFPLQLVEKFSAPYRIEPLSDEEIPAGIIVTSDSALREHIRGLPDARLVLEIPAADTLYARALRNPFVLRVLAWVRPPDRFATYRDKSVGRTVFIYRVGRTARADEL